MNKHIAISAFLAVALGAAQIAVAATVYQWTDEEGLVHFSDAPPGDSAITEHQQIELQAYAQTNADPEQYSIVNQLETMAEWRRQTTEERMARKQLQLEAQRVANERNANRYNVIESGLYQQPVYYPVYSVYPRYGRKGHGMHTPAYHQQQPALDIRPGHFSSHSSSVFNSRSSFFRFSAGF